MSPPSKTTECQNATLRPERFVRILLEELGILDGKFETFFFFIDSKCLLTFWSGKHDQSDIFGHLCEYSNRRQRGHLKHQRTICKQI